MKTLSPQLDAHLKSGATSLCYCWKITRADSLQLGFTDHDRELTFDGVAFRPETGAIASAIDNLAGLAADNMSVIGVLNSGEILGADLAADVYDNALVEIYRVNWTDVAQRVLLKTGRIGEVERRGADFTAELRGLTSELEQETGRRYQHACDVDLGDARCGVDLSDPTFKGSGAVVIANDARLFTASGLDNFTDDWFAHGKLSWTAGANAGRSREVKRHIKAATSVTIELWRPMPAAIAASDTFDVTAGCDKRFETCRDKFNNVLNFRGFHLMPGNDFLQIVPRPGEGRDGGKLR